MNKIDLIHAEMAGYGQATIETARRRIIALIEQSDEVKAPAHWWTELCKVADMLKRDGNTLQQMADDTAAPEPEPALRQRWIIARQTYIPRVGVGNAQPGTGD